MKRIQANPLQIEEAIKKRRLSQATEKKLVPVLGGTRNIDADVIKKLMDEYNFHAAKKGVKKFVFDIGMQTPSKGAVVFAALQGAADGGLEVSFDKEMVPTAKLANPPEKLKAAFEAAKNKCLKGE